ncbi:MAG: alpha/beta hydrolase [Vulcanimicrobiaceae bacterium]
MRIDLLRTPAPPNEVAFLRYEARRPRGVTLVAGHGYSSSKHNLDALCAFLAGHGFTVYSLDFPGHKLGASGGRLGGVDDCIAAMSAVVGVARSREQAGPVYVMGHSMGAMTAIFSAALDPQLAGVIAIATGYGRPSAIAAMQRAGVADFRSAYVDGVTLPELLVDVDARYAQLLPRLAGRPCLYVSAGADGMVSPASVAELYTHAPEPKTLATIHGDHTYAAEHARGEVLAWLNALHPR